MTRAWERSTIVVLAPHAVFELQGDELLVGSREPSERVPRAFLETLAVFLTPRTLESGLEHLAAHAQGLQGLSEAFGSLLRLCEAGVLVPPGTSVPTVRTTRGFGPPGQIRMLEDAARTGALLEAVRASVKPGDVVLDLGTGTGVLAVAAAKAGARRVYAIESGAIAEDAQRLIEASGFADRITLLRGRSLDLELPEPADLLVSEILGHDPLSEGILESYGDALARLLRPGARVLPSRLRLFASAVEVPERERARTLFTPALTDRWSRRYRMPFRALAAPAAPRTRPQLALVNPRKAGKWALLGGPSTILDLDLAAPPSLPVTADLPLPIASAGQVGGILLHFTADLGGEGTLTSDPSRSGPRQHWKCPLWLLPLPAAVTAGQILHLRYAYRRGESSLDVMDGAFPGTEP